MSQKEMIKRHFDSGRSLTVLTAIEKYGIYALSQRCGDLRKEGYPVEGTLIKLPSGKHVMSYKKGGADLISRVFG